MRISLEQWTDEKISVGSEFFIGTKRNCVDKGKFAVDIILVSAVARTRTYTSDVQAEKAENEIWDAMTKFDDSSDTVN